MVEKVQILFFTYEEVTIQQRKKNVLISKASRLKVPIMQNDRF